MFGFLNIDKPSGVTSRAGVNALEDRFPSLKVGHAGTLDPLATGVLILGIGQATRLLEYVQRMPKTYVATFLFGQSSDTNDIEGEVVALEDSPVPSREMIERCLPEYEGSILQRPPKYSAIKIQGRRAYEMARRGEAVDLEPREVTIHSLQILRYAYPEIEAKIVCSRGTYVRALGRDLAQRLNTSAVMSQLCRTAIGAFDQAKSASLESITPETVARYLLPPQSGLEEIRRFNLTQPQVVELSHGRTLDLDFPKKESHLHEEAYGLYKGRLIAILKQQTGTTWAPHKVFSPPNTATPTDDKA